MRVWFAGGEPENAYSRSHIHYYHSLSISAATDQPSSSITCPPNRFTCLWTHSCTGLPQPSIGATRSILLDMANNTPLEEFASLKDVKPTENAQFQGIVISVSPMKKGQVATYFDAKIADEEKEIRIVGFSSNLRKRMAALEDKEEPSCYTRKLQDKKSKILRRSRNNCQASNYNSHVTKETRYIKSYSITNQSPKCR